MKEDPEIYYHLGVLYMKKGEWSQAKSYLGLALAWAKDGSKLKEKILYALDELSKHINISDDANTDNSENSEIKETN